MQHKGLPPGEERFLRACFEGDAQAVAAYLRNDSNKVHDNALTNACAQGHEDIVELLLSDPRVDPGAQRNSAFGAAVIHKHPAIMRRLFPLIMTPDAEKQCYEFALNHGHQLAHLYPFLIQHSRTAPVNAFLGANDADTLRALLDKPRVTLCMHTICQLIFGRRADLLRVFLETPWLGFSRRTLFHFQSLAKRRRIPHVFPPSDASSPWEEEECAVGCSHLHGDERVFEYSKAHPQALAIVWCMHQAEVGWADMAEPTLARLPHVVVMELDSEGPAFGITGAPKKPPFLVQRVFYGSLGLLVLLLGCVIVFRKARDSVDYALGIFLLIFGLAVITGSVAIPRVIYK